MDTLEQRFKTLKERLQDGILNITEVYINHSQQNLIYRPVTFISFNELIEGRLRLTEKAHLRLTGIELELDKVVEVCPLKSRARGCFHLTEWLNPDFTPGEIPGVVLMRKYYLERNSGWLRGGPR